MTVAGAVVTVVGADVKGTTDVNGRFTLLVPRTRLRGEQIQIQVDALGLPTETAEAVVRGATVTIDVALRLAFAEQVIVGSRPSGTAAEKAVPVDIIPREPHDA